MIAIAARQPEFEASTAEPPRASKRRTDWTGLWFSIVEREGEFIGMRGGQRAEGRLVLGDALALADEESPDLLIDMATLTGAARVALGPDLPPFYTDDDGLAADLARHAVAANDPLWRMPFWTPYYALIDSAIAELNNAGESGFAGSVTAALFLKRFVERAK